MSIVFRQMLAQHQALKANSSFLAKPKKVVSKKNQNKSPALEKVKKVVSFNNAEFEQDVSIIYQAQDDDEKKTLKLKYLEKYEAAFLNLKNRESYNNIRFIFYYIAWGLDMYDDRAIYWGYEAINKGLNTPVRFERNYPTFFVDCLRFKLEKIVKEKPSNPNILNDCLKYSQNLASRADELEIKSVALAKLLKVIGVSFEQNLDKKLEILKKADSLCQGMGLKKILKDLTIKINESSARV